MYEYLPQFDDVNGWDLQHARRVCWYRLPEPYEFDEAVFGANPARWSRVNKPELVEYANRFVNSPPTDWQSAALPQLPVPEEPVDMESLPQGLRTVIADMQALGDVYYDSDVIGEGPSEAEGVSHLVVPFLRGLGWPAENIGVEWRGIDVTVFAELPRTPENCRYLIEAKALGAPIEGARGQAEGYAAKLGVPLDVVVTDGLRYRMYAASEGYLSVAYANIRRLKQSSEHLFTRMRAR